MLVDFKRPTSHIKYLSSLSSDKWIELAISNPIDILIDHAHCERKAAGVAIQLSLDIHQNQIWQKFLVQ